MLTQFRCLWRIFLLLWLFSELLFIFCSSDCVVSVPDGLSVSPVLNAPAEILTSRLHSLPHCLSFNSLLTRHSSVERRLQQIVWRRSGRSDSLPFSLSADFFFFLNLIVCPEAEEIFKVGRCSSSCQIAYLTTADLLPGSRLSCWDSKVRSTRTHLHNTLHTVTN